MKFAIKLDRATFLHDCPHDFRWFRYVDTGEYTWARHQRLIGRRIMIPAASFRKRGRNSTGFLTKAASAYPPRMNRELALAMARAITRARHAALRSKLTTMQAAAADLPSVQTDVVRPDKLRGPGAPDVKRLQDEAANGGMRNPTKALQKLPKSTVAARIRRV